MNSLLVGHLIGKGAFGFVYQGVVKGLDEKEKGTTVAIKTVRGKFLLPRSQSKTIHVTLDDASAEEVENLLKELSVMKMVGKHTNIISLLGCCTKGGQSGRSLIALEHLHRTGQVMLIVEYAKHGNLRDYLRRKRPPGHVLAGSFESPSDVDHDEQESIFHQDADDLNQTLGTMDLLLFCLQIASGMEYLHSKKVIDEQNRRIRARYELFSVVHPS